MNQRNLMSTLKSKIVMIATHLSGKAAKYFRDLHNTTAENIEIVDPSRFATSDQLLKFIEVAAAQGSLVYIPRSVLSQAYVTSAKKGGIPFVELRQNDGGVVTAVWNNIGPDQQTFQVSSDEEIQALKAGKVLVSAS